MASRGQPDYYLWHHGRESSGTRRRSCAGQTLQLADKLSKLIPFEVGMTLSKAMEDSEELRSFVNENDEVAEIMEMAYKLEGIVRNVGRHAGGW